MVTVVDARFQSEVARYDLRCTCDSCHAFEPNDSSCVYGYPTAPHRRLPLLQGSDFVFCKGFELA